MISLVIVGIFQLFLCFSESVVLENHLVYLHETFDVSLVGGQIDNNITYFMRVNSSLPEWVNEYSSTTTTLSGMSPEEVIIGYGGFVHNNRLYVVSGGLKVFNISDVSNPILITSILSKDFSGWYRIGPIVFLAKGREGIYVVDISEETPQVIDTFSINEYPCENMVAINYDELIVYGDMDSGSFRNWKTVNITQYTIRIPNRPPFPQRSTSGRFALHDDYLFVLCADAFFVFNRHTMEEIGDAEYSSSGWIPTMGVSYPYVYVCSEYLSDEEIQILDLSDPEDPIRLAFTYPNQGCYGSAISVWDENLLILGDVILDLSIDPGNPTVKSTKEIGCASYFDDTDLNQNVKNASLHYCVGINNNRLKIWNITSSEPSDWNPTMISSIDMDTHTMNAVAYPSANEVRYILSADRMRGLVVYDNLFSSEISIVYSAVFQSPNDQKTNLQSKYIALVSSHAYLLSYNCYSVLFTVYDVSDPITPILVHTEPNDDSSATSYINDMFEMVVSGRYGYIGCRNRIDSKYYSCVLVYDLIVPSNPQYVTHYVLDFGESNPSSFFIRLDSERNLIFVAGYGKNLILLLDISNPLSINELSRIILPVEIRSFERFKDVLYVIKGGDKIIRVIETTNKVLNYTGEFSYNEAQYYFDRLNIFGEKWLLIDQNSDRLSFFEISHDPKNPTFLENAVDKGLSYYVNYGGIECRGVFFAGHTQKYVGYRQNARLELKGIPRAREDCGNFLVKISSLEINTETSEIISKMDSFELRVRSSGYYDDFCNVFLCNDGVLSNQSFVCHGNGKCENPPNGVCVCWNGWDPTTHCAVCKLEYQDFPNCTYTPDKNKTDPSSPSNPDPSTQKDDDGGNNEYVVPLVASLVSVFVITLCCCVLLLFCCLLCLLCCICCSGISLFLCGGSGLYARKIAEERKYDKFDKLLKTELLNENPEIQINEALFEIKYENLKVLRSIGRGGSSSVIFHVKWKGKHCAFKCFQTRDLFGSKEEYDEFEREVEVMSSLSHDNILEFYGACLHPPRCGIVMEFCSNGDLKKYLSLHYDTPTIERIRILRHICDGMEYLHDRNVIHRDLKSENVLLTKDLVPKIIDFGLSKIYQRMSVHKTSKVGTSFYTNNSFDKVAPEIVLGEDYSTKCDVFSFAILAWEVLACNFCPFGEAVYNIEYKVANDENCRPDLWKISNDVHEDFPEVIKAIQICWKRDPKERFDFSELKKMFEERSGEENRILESDNESDELSAM